MKKLFACILATCVLTLTAGAAYVPDDVVSENLDGRQLIVKTYTLSPGEDPDALIGEPFEQDGFVYTYSEMVKEEHPFEERRTETQTVTVNTDSKDLTAVLEALAATIPFDDGEYAGTLSLDHTTIKTEAAGYTSKSYTVSETKQIGGLDRNDPSYVPATTVKNGQTLSLSNISWAVEGTSLADGALIPTSYMATATYTGHGSSKVATGYVTTAQYAGEVVSSGISSIGHTVTYLGEPIKLQAAEAKLHQVTEQKVVNSTAYTMAVIFNTIWESESDLLVDPYLNYLYHLPPRAGVAGEGA